MMKLPVSYKEIGDVDLVLQQGVTESVLPLSEEELKTIADKLARRVFIRTREGGEVIYESDRSRRASRKR